MNSPWVINKTKPIKINVHQDQISSRLILSPQSSPSIVEPERTYNENRTQKLGTGWQRTFFEMENSLLFIPELIRFIPGFGWTSFEWRTDHKVLIPSTVERNCTNEWELLQAIPAVELPTLDNQTVILVCSQRNEDITTIHEQPIEVTIITEDKTPTTFPNVYLPNIQRFRTTYKADFETVVMDDILARLDVNYNVLPKGLNIEELKTDEIRRFFRESFFALRDGIREIISTWEPFSFELIEGNFASALLNRFYAIWSGEDAWHPPTLEYTEEADASLDITLPENMLSLLPARLLNPISQVLVNETGKRRPWKYSARKEEISSFRFHSYVFPQALISNVAINPKIWAILDVDFSTTATISIVIRTKKGTFPSETGFNMPMYSSPSYFVPDRPVMIASETPHSNYLWQTNTNQMPTLYCTRRQSFFLTKTNYENGCIALVRCVLSMVHTRQATPSCLKLYKEWVREADVSEQKLYDELQVYFDTENMQTLANYIYRRYQHKNLKNLLDHLYSQLQIPILFIRPSASTVVERDVMFDESPFFATYLPISKWNCGWVFICFGNVCCSVSDYPLETLAESMMTIRPRFAYSNFKIPVKQFSSMIKELSINPDPKWTIYPSTEGIVGSIFPPVWDMTKTILPLCPWVLDTQSTNGKFVNIGHMPVIRLNTDPVTLQPTDLPPFEWVLKDQKTLPKTIPFALAFDRQESFPSCIPVRIWKNGEVMNFTARLLFMCERRETGKLLGETPTAAPEGVFDQIVQLFKKALNLSPNVNDEDEDDERLPVAISQQPATLLPTSVRIYVPVRPVVPEDATFLRFIKSAKRDLPPNTAEIETYEVSLDYTKLDTIDIALNNTTKSNPIPDLLVGFYIVSLDD